MKSATERKADSQDRKAREGISRDLLFEFLYGEKDKELLDDMWSEVKEGNTDMMKWFADQYFGRAKQSTDIDLDAKNLSIKFTIDES